MKYRYSKIVITGDIFRPFLNAGEYESGTWKNVRWLKAILWPALRHTGLDISLLSWDEGLQRSQGVYFDAPFMYRKLDRELSLDGWGSLATTQTAIPQISETLAPLLSESLVIGYEMPDVMLATLSELGIPYIDILLHPVRFLPDLVFAMRTNVASYHRFLASNRLSDQLIERQSSLIQAKIAWMQKPHEMPPGSVLILGQVSNDRALLRPNHGFSSLANHAEQIHKLCCDHPAVYFKAHPYDEKNSLSQRMIMQLPTIKHTNANFYHLLAQPELEGVVALNSSGLIEAKVFNKWAQNLIPFLYEFGNESPPENAQPGGVIPQNGRWIEPDFWQTMLCESSYAQKLETKYLMPENLLRRSMNADWGYGFIEKVVA